MTEKNKHASIRKMEKFVKCTLQSLTGGAGEGTGSGRGARPLAPGLFRFRVWKGEIGPVFISTNQGCRLPSRPLL